MKALLSLILLFSTSMCFSQVSGYVTTTGGDALSYATIYVKDSFKGTTTNDEGFFSITLESGEYDLVFQYVGYEPAIINVKIDDSKVKELNVILEEESFDLEEVVISADVEDPAYAIIRKAIEKRDLYLNEVQQYQADLYIKGLVKIDETPEKFMGIDLGDMEGILDSNRQGIIYLSESKSKVYYKAPDQLKEVMYASKVAGDLDGISFNQYADVNFSFYNEYINFGRNLLSPLADNSLRFYTYRLEGTRFDGNGNMVNKIAVIPKNENDPVFSGYIYIIDDSWRIYTADLKATGVSAKNSIYDYIAFKQIYIPVTDGDKWILFSQVMNFKIGLLVFKFNGAFTYFFSNHDFSDIDDGVFTSETFRAEKDANKRDSTYWKENRPVPITQEERKDYYKKDSLEVLWNSKPYLDSLDRESNKLRLFNILFGYTYSNSFEKRAWSYMSPLNSIQFNAVEGFKISLDTRYEKYNKKRTEYFWVEPKISYGFGDKQLRPTLAIAKRFNSIKYTTAGINIGREVRQINEENPVPVGINTIESLLAKNNILSLFESDFINASYRSELFNGLRADLLVEYQNRKPLSLNSDYSLFNKDESFSSNYPLCVFCPIEESFVDNKIVRLDAKFRYRIGQTYMSMNDFRITQKSNWPDLLLRYKKGISVDGGDLGYDFLSLTITDTKVDLNLWGYLGYSIEAGTFLTSNNLTAIDYKHFRGNMVNYNLGANYLNTYKVLHNYVNSTSRSYVSLFSEYHLEGRLMDKIPVLKNWNIKSVIGYNLLRIKETSSNYQELSFGLENIGIKGIPILRLDYVWTFRGTNYLDSALVLGIFQEF